MEAGPEVIRGDLYFQARFLGLVRKTALYEPSHPHCATDRAESADAHIEMTWRKAFPAILRLRDRSYKKPIEQVQWKALRALRTAAARAQSYSHPGHRSRQSDRRIHPFVWRQSLLPLVLSGRAKHPYRPRCS